MHVTFDSNRFTILLLFGITAVILLLTGIYEMPRYNNSTIVLMLAFVMFLSLTGSVFGGALGRPGLGWAIGLISSLWLAYFSLIMSKP